MARKEYSEETKAAVLAALLSGQAVGEVARAYAIPAATVRSWKSRQAGEGGVAKVATQKKERIGDLLVRLVETEVETLIRLSETMREREWVLTQNAADLAVLGGVKYDKLMRMLEAFGGGDEDEPAAPATD